MIGLTQQHHYFLREHPTDMRKGFDGLSGLIKSDFSKDPLDGSVYIFINRRRDRMKMLVFEQGGFMMYYKRLEQGTFELPQAEQAGEAISITWEVLVLMISGIKLDKIVRKKRYKRA
jgi:transposase